jgi:hypothetical protein
MFGFSVSLLYHLYLKIAEFAEVFYLFDIVAIEEQLVETGVVEHILLSIDFYLNGDDTTSTWWNIYIINDGTG